LTLPSELFVSRAINRHSQCETQGQEFGAQNMTSSWAAAYNAGDAKALLTLYADDAAFSTVQDTTVMANQRLKRSGLATSDALNLRPP
jgi:ketosteroid isomerase-like protein